MILVQLLAIELKIRLMYLVIFVIASIIAFISLFSYCSILHNRVTAMQLQHEKELRASIEFMSTNAVIREEFLDEDFSLSSNDINSISEYILRSDR